MDLVGFQFATVVALVYAVLKWLLMGLLVAASRIWNRTPLAVALGAGAVLVVVGSVFRIEHWLWGSELMVAGAAVVAGTYGQWFRGKRPRQSLDYLKLAWVLAAMGTVVGAAGFQPLIKPLGGLAEALFWAVALLFVYQRWRLRPGPAAE